MRKNVHFGEAGEVEARPFGQIGESGAGEAVAALPLQHRVELLPQRVQMEDIGGGISELRVGQRLHPPVGRLLLLADLDPDEFAGEVFQPVPIRVGAGELGGDLGAIDGRGHHPEGMGQDGDVEAAEMEQLDDVRVGQQPLEVGRVLLTRRDLHDFGVAVAARQLDNAQPVAPDRQAERFGVEGDGLAVSPAGRKVGAVQADGQSAHSGRLEATRATTPAGVEERR